MKKYAVSFWVILLPLLVSATTTALGGTPIVQFVGRANQAQTGPEEIRPTVPAGVASHSPPVELTGTLQDKLHATRRQRLFPPLTPSAAVDESGRPKTPFQEAAFVPGLASSSEVDGLAPSPIHEQTEPPKTPSIVVHPPRLTVGRSGKLLMRPQLQVSGQPMLVAARNRPVNAEDLGVALDEDDAAMDHEGLVEGDVLYEDEIYDGEIQYDDGYSGFAMQSVGACSCGSCGTCQANACCDVQVNPVLSRVGCCFAERLFGSCGCKEPYSEAGIGHEWMPLAPFAIQRAMPLNHIGFRFAAAYDHVFPDRAEYLWAKSPGGGPNAGVGEQSVDYQDFRFRFETGGKRFSAATEIPIRVLDPILNQNTAGLGDMTLTTRAVLLDGEDWQITQVLNSYFNTGSATHGTGNGHISLEPGLLARWELSDFTHLHGELKYWFPLGADADHAGEVLRYGLGISRLAYDCDAFGLIATLEFVAGTFLDGAQTRPGAIVAEPIDGIGFLNIHPGARFVFDSPGDWGVWDLGLSGGIAVTGSRMYDGILMFDMRWAF